MSDYGDNYGMCNNDEQREWYKKGFEDGKGGTDKSAETPALFTEFYRFGMLDASGG